MASQIQLRRDTAANWTSVNPTLASGEIGYVTDTKKFKIGDGTTAWSSLAYFNGNLANASLDDLSDVTITSAANGDFLRWNGSAWVNDAVNLGTDTAGSFVESLVAGTGVTVTNNSGEASTPTIAIGQSVATSASPTFANVTISNAPTSDSHAATKAYVDYHATGIIWHDACRLATAAVLPGTPNYNNGTSGVGATLTATSNARLIVDGTNATNGDRILVKDQADAKQNGVYVVTAQGSVSAPYVLTRATDFDASPPFEDLGTTGDAVYVGAGAFNVSQGFLITSTGSGTAGAHVIGTDEITFSQFTGTAAFSAGTGVVISGNTINVQSANSGRIVVNADDIDLATVTRTDGSGTAGKNFVQSITTDSYGRVTGATTANLSILTLGTDTNGSYVESITAGTGITVTGSSGEGSTPTVAVTANTYDAYGAAATAASNAATALSNHEADTTSVHGIADTSILATTTGTQTFTNKTLTSPTINNPTITGVSPVITLNGDLTGSVTLTDLGNGTLTATIAANSVALGTDTTGSYVASLVAGSGITITNNSGENATPTIAVTADTYQPLDADLTAIAALSGTSGLLKKTAADTWALDTTAYLTSSTGVTTVNGASGAITGVVTTGDTGTVTNTMLAGSIADSKLSTISTAGKVSNSATTAASTNTSSAIVARDSSGNFSAGTITATLSGNASTASALANARTISLTGDVTGSVSFDGSADASITATIAANSVALGTDTTGNYVASLVAGTGITLSNNSGENATPTVAVDTSTIATKSYVDSATAGMNWHDAANIATTTVLPGSPTYSNGTAGVGATLTATSNARLVVDSVNATTGDRILVKDQGDGTQNGIYDVTNQGSASAPYVLTRSSDTNNSVPGQVKAGDAVFVLAGSTHANQGFIQTSIGTGTSGATVIGTDSIVYTQFTGAATLTAGNGISKTGNTLNVGTASTSRIVVNADDIDLATVSVSSLPGGTGTSFIKTMTVDSWGRITGYTTGDVQTATTTDLGIASFSTNNFSVSSGAVSIKSGGVTNTNIQYPWVVINGYSIYLGDTITITAAAGTLTGTSLNSTVVSSSLTSVGTIGTGTWQGSVVGATYGGTGVNNGSNTITLAGNLVTSGAYALTLTTTATTNVTLPSTGTLATLAGSETFTNKTLTSPTVSTPALTLSTSTSTTAGRIAYDSTGYKIIVGDGSTAREYASSTIVTNAQSASYTAVLADKDKMIEMNVASANTLTIPPNSSVAYPVGTQIRVLQTNSGQTTITPGSGVTINGTPGLKLRTQWASATIIKRATDTWVAVGDLSA